MFVAILLLSLGLLIFHVFGVPYYFKSPEKPGAVFKTQLISLGIAIVVVIVLFAISETDLWNEDLMTLSIGILMVVTSLSALDLYMLRATYKKKHTEEAFIAKYARQEERMKEIAEREKEIELKGNQLESRGKEFETLKTFLDNQKEQIKSRESAIIEKESVLNNRTYSLDSREEQIDQLVRGKLVAQERDIEERLQVFYNQKFTDHVNAMSEKMERRISSEKQSMVQDVFSFDGKGSDDIFELKRTKESINKEKAELEKNRFLLEVDERVSKAKEHVLDAKKSALEVKSENTDLRSDMKVMAGEFKMELNQEKAQREKSLDDVRHKFELEEERRKSDYKDVGNMIALLAEQTKGKFIELTSMFSDNLKDLEMRTMTSFREVRENLSDMKLQFGQEVLRLDSQQGQILTELEKYHNKNQEFVNKCQSLALDARKQNIEGSNILNQVTFLYNQHKVDARAMENQLQTSLDQVAVKEGHLANRVGESMLQLKSISEQQFIAMKDLALEKKDVNLLWREKNQEHEMNLQEVQHQKQDLDRMKQFLDQEKSHFNDRKAEVMDNARLTHQLYMTEHRYTEALKKAQSSQGFLTRIAKAAEYAMSAK